MGESTVQKTAQMMASCEFCALLVRQDDGYPIQDEADISIS
jgi:hypothetical protein